MDLLLLGSNYFQKALLELGHRAFWAADDPKADLSYPGGEPSLPKILDSLPFTPEAVILTDDLGRRVLPSGLEKIEALKVWYAVDSPINYYWHKHYAPLFDLVLVDQKEHAARLSALNPAGAHWLPVAVDTALYQGPPEKKLYDLAFVGVVNERVRPKRSRVISLLSQKYSLHTAGGRQGAWVFPAQAARLYRQSRFVLNENLFPGVTTRMFEAMAAGSALLSESESSGLEDLFQPGVDLVLYGPDDIFAQVDHWLAENEKRENMAVRGRDKVLTAHDIKHRAATMLGLINITAGKTGLPEGGAFYREQGKALFLTGLRWPAADGLNKVLRAEDDFRRAEYFGSLDSESLFYSGLIAKFKNDCSRAKTKLTAAAETGSIRARVGLAWLELETRSHWPALVHFRKAAETARIDFPAKFPQGSTLSADQHYVLGQVLEYAGHDLTPGFSRFGLDVAMWNALEHYITAVKKDPKHLQALSAAGALLFKYKAYTEAYHFLERAAALASRSEELAAAAHEAGRKGYLLVESERMVA
ncbi:MAG: glycosyltransferase [Pseudomonadota bacterium]